MKKRMRMISIVLLGTMLMAGCGNSKDPADDSATAFEGEYMVTADYVKEHIGDENVLLIDCRGEKYAEKETIEGAIEVVWQDICTCDDSYGAAGDEGWGKIPEASELEEILGSYGISKDKEIITIGYTTDGWGDDARVAWELLAAGYENVKMVDGGYTALENADVPTQKGASEPVACDVEIDEIDMTHVMETEPLADNYDEYVVLDVRTEKEYNGATKYGEAEGGHLPGAIFFPYTELFNSDDTLKANADIVAMLEEAGVEKEDNIVTYCTGGIRSAYVQMVLEMCGYENTWNYDQSYWRWCVVNEVEK